MRFYVTAPSGRNLEGHDSFDSIDEANERADELRHRGIVCFVEAREPADDVAENFRPMSLLDQVHARLTRRRAFREPPC
jgi:hypothetical protein